MFAKNKKKSKHNKYVKTCNHKSLNKERHYLCHSNEQMSHCISCDELRVSELILNGYVDKLTDIKSE